MDIKLQFQDIRQIDELKITLKNAKLDTPSGATKVVINR